MTPPSRRKAANGAAGEPELHSLVQNWSVPANHRTTDVSRRSVPAGGKREQEK